VTGVPSQAKRQAILGAATAAFLRAGYAASVDEIASAAGVGKQTVYRHFGDKESLFLAAVAAARDAETANDTARNAGAANDTARNASGAARNAETTNDADSANNAERVSGTPAARADWSFPAAGRAADPLAGLTAIGEAILTATLSPTVAALHRLTIAEIGNHPELSRHWGDGAAPILDDGLTGYLRRCHEAGLLDVPDPARAARQFAYLLARSMRS
jgi:TetR/AcrR family transcriptional repressor of mexJK operon